MKVNIVRGGARIPDVLHMKPALPQAAQSFNSKQVAWSWFRGCDIHLPVWPSWGAAGFAFTLSPATPLPSLPPEHSRKETHEERCRHTVSWAQGQVTFPIQHLYKSYLMKLRGKKN